MKEGRRRRLKMQLALNKHYITSLPIGDEFWIWLVFYHCSFLIPRFSFVSRTFCRLKRNTGWWKNVCNTYSEARFMKTFRASQVIFNFILNRIKPFLVRQTVTTEEPISPALRLVICLYRLGKGYCLYTVAEMASLSTGLIWEICFLIIVFVLPKIHFCCHFLSKTWLAVRHRTACFPPHYFLIVLKHGTPHSKVVNAPQACIFRALEVRGTHIFRSSRLFVA